MAFPVNVLVFPCGSENALELHDALIYSPKVNLIGMSSVEDYGRILFDSYIGSAPNIKDPGFLSFFEEKVKEFGIDLIFATHDTVLEYLAPVCLDLGVYLVNGDPVTTRVARSKALTYEIFKDRIWAPVVYDPLDVDCFPVIVKPDKGQGGQGVRLCSTQEELAEAVLDTKECVVVEYLPGEEITVDCFTDRFRNLIWVGARTRERVRSGISMRSHFQDMECEIENIAIHINERLVLRGPWFFQLKRSANGQWKLLEIAARASGTMVFQRVRGINLPLMTVQDYLSEPLSIAPTANVEFIERRITTHAKLDKSITAAYIVLEGTLVWNGCANPLLMHFIYKWKVGGGQIYLIANEEGEVDGILQDAKISSCLFDEIILLRNGECKSLFVKPGSIFVDSCVQSRERVIDRVNAFAVDVGDLQFYCY